MANSWECPVCNESNAAAFDHRDCIDGLVEERDALVARNRGLLANAADLRARLEQAEEQSAFWARHAEVESSVKLTYLDRLEEAKWEQKRARVLLGQARGWTHVLTGEEPPEHARIRDVKEWRKRVDGYLSGVSDE